MASSISRYCISLAALAFLISSVTAAAGDFIFADDFSNPGPGPTQSCTVNPDSNGFFTLTSTASNYVVRLPPAYEVAHPRPSRLLVALHGCNDTAINFATWAAVPFALRSSQNYIAISVGGRDGACWNLSTDAALVNAAIAHVRSCFYVHQERIVLGGYSSGGGLAYKLAMTDALTYAGVLIEHSSLRSVVGSSNVDAALNAAAWKLNIGHAAGINDLVYLIADVHSDMTKIVAHGFPMQYREDASDHNGSSSEWSDYLIPLMANWSLP